MPNLNPKPETHPNWYKDVPKMKCLILGSFPPHESRRDYPFYYPNSSNRFWDILAKIAKKELTPIKNLTKKEKAVEERYEIMRLLNVGVQNIGLEIKRKGESADDNDIEITKFQNILSIIKKHSELEKILLAGFSAPNSTAKSFLKYLDSENIPYNIKVKDIKANTEFTINVFNRKIKCVVLNSTSRRAAGIAEDELLKQFKKHLL
ncbi:hypothetical protein R83H12_01956 [Fibrobacteria bacterium R8-3-H12]